MNAFGSKRTGIAILLIVLNVTFFPFIWGNRTLEESANHAPSLYNVGSRPSPVYPYVMANVLDPGGAAWQEEPAFAVSHDLTFLEKTPPVWNPYASYGVPLAADAQAQPYSPFAWIGIVWNTARGFNVFVVLRIFVGGLFAFLYLRMFLRSAPALVGATAFMFSGYYWYYLTMPHLSVEVLLPAMLYALEFVLRRPGFLAAGVLALVVGALILGGMPESTALALLFGVVYVAGRIFFDREIRANLRSSALHVSLGTLLGLGLSAAMVIPLLEYLPISWNSHAGATLGLQADAVTWPMLAGYLSPLFFRPWGFGEALRGFCGCGALFFALVAFFSSAGDALKRRMAGTASVELVFGIVAVVLLAKRFGMWGVNWIGGLPILKQIIFVKYQEAEIGCCIALLAGFGVARLCEKRAAPASIWVAAVIPLAILSLAAAQMQPQFQSLAQGKIFYTFGLSSALVFLGLAVAIAAAVYAGRLKPAYMAAAALALVFLEPLATYVVPLEYVVNTPEPQSVSALQGAPYIAYLKSAMRNGERLYAQDSALYPQWAGAFGLEDVGGLDALFPARYLPFVSAFFPGNGGAALGRFTGAGGDTILTPMGQRFLALSSARYIVAYTDLTRSGNYGKAHAFRNTYAGPDGVYVYEYRSPLPRISIFHRIVNAPTPDSALALLTSSSFAPGSEAIAEGQSRDFAQLASAGRAAVTGGSIRRYTSTDVRARVQTNGPSFVVLNDTNYPGWVASIDGHRTPIYPANYLFRGIIVPAGAHDIEFRYAPASLAAGIALSLVSLILVACLGTLGFVRKPL